MYWSRSSRAIRVRSSLCRDSVSTSPSLAWSAAIIRFDRCSRVSITWSRKIPAAALVSSGGPAAGWKKKVASGPDAPPKPSGPALRAAIPLRIPSLWIRYAEITNILDFHLFAAVFDAIF